MHKDKLLKIIERARRTEEDAVASFSKHVQTASDWIAFDEDEKKRVLEILKRLENDSRAHRTAMNNLADTVAKEECDDY